MDGLAALAPGARFEGVGGPLMSARGLASLFPMEELSVMGLAEVLPRYPHLRRRMIQTADAAIRADPDVVVTIDAPDFGLRVARRVRAARPGARLVHYVAPSVWAWRPGRARRMRGLVDLVLALLPFEPAHLEAAGVPCRFVGHPIAAWPPPDRAAARAFRGEHGLGGPVLCVLPGSRRSEVARLAPVFGQMLLILCGQRPGLRVVVPAAPAVAASGTVSLELAHAGVPMVVAYDVHPLTRAILARMLRVDAVTLVNLVSETRAVPEFLGRDCRPEPIAAAAGRLLDGEHDQAAAMRLTMERLGAGGPPPGERAARAVLDLL